MSLVLSLLGRLSLGNVLRGLLVAGAVIGVGYLLHGQRQSGRYEAELAAAHRAIQRLSEESTRRAQFLTARDAERGRIESEYRGLRVRFEKLLQDPAAAEWARTPLPGDVAQRLRQPATEE